MITLAGRSGGSTDAALPRPARERWQPLRAGLVDLFLYDYEEFWFRDGHLLLRGNNGTGKSKVLALTLPFLLDGELAAWRVEPDGDRSKRMEWNLLLDQRYEERLGYAWLEFGRLDEDGDEEYFTVGCGMKAVRGRGIASRWFLTTDARVGVSLWLVGPSGTALTRDRLIDALAGRGLVHDQAEAYRRAIDERLFHLGESRYRALIDLLIQLRQPQLSRRLDEASLSGALSEALAPVDQAVLSDVAAAFHDLEQQRRELAGLIEVRTDVERFLEGFRHYGQIAARRSARELREAYSAHEETVRQLNAVREALLELRRTEVDGEEDGRGLARDLMALRAESQELRTSPEVRQLETVENAARQARDGAVSAAERRDEAHADLREREASLDTARDSVANGRQALTALLAGAEQTAARAGLEADHARLLSPLALPDGDPDRAAVDAAETASGEAAKRKEEAVRHVRQLARDAAELQRRLVDANRRRDDVAGERDAAVDRRALADRGAVEAGTILTAAWRRYLSALVEVTLPDTEQTIEALAAWRETLAGDNPAQVALGAAAAAARNDRAQDRAHAVAERERAETFLGALAEERQRLLQGEDATPPEPYTRSAGVREGRAGAPFWQVVDFRGEATGSDRAGIEAALEASGLLDAWVTPEGQLVDRAAEDVVVTVGRHAHPNLASLLVPAIDPEDRQAATLAPDVVEGILAGVGLGPGAGGTWVDPSGSWRLGVTEGRWSKDVAVFVGKGAREAARHRRLAELEGEIEAAVHAVGAARAAVAAVEHRQQALESEVAEAPADRALRDAHAAAGAAARDVRQWEEKLAGEDQRVGEAEQAASRAARERDDAAADLQLPAVEAALQEVADGLGAYRVATAGLWPEARAHGDRRRRLSDRERDVAQASRRLAARSDEAEAGERAAIDAETRRDTVAKAIGATVDEIRSRLEWVTGRIRAVEEKEGELAEAQRAHAKRLGHAEGRQRDLEERLDGALERRAGAVASFQHFAATGLLATAAPGLAVPDPTLPWAPDPAVRLARRLEQALGSVEAGDETWERIRREILARVKDLTDAMSVHGHQAEAEMVDGLVVVSVIFQGRRRAPAELAELLTQEIADRERLLSARERELLEEHLVNEVASHLQELISDAESHVAQMNAELEDRPTSTGVRLRLAWEPRPEGPSGLVEARRRLLRQAADAWSPDDRAAVSAFLQELVEGERLANEDGTWLDHLTAAFDYRRWHRFVIERWQDGRWRAAGEPASSGERALTVTLPLFAAASAHYRSAHVAAPRLVMLDEAFAGVDDDSRAKSMGLLSTFDLDFAMTSEREWGCYPTIPGLSIHQLSRKEGLDAVYVTRWHWDGRTRTRFDPDIPGMTPGEDV